MITVVYRIVAKEGKREELIQIIHQFTKCAHKSVDCHYYTFFQSLENNKEFLVYYRFANKIAQDDHIKNLHKKIGPAPTGRDLPEKFLNLIDQEELILFKDE